MKTYNESQLISKSAEYFKQEPEQKSIFATTDGTFFWPKQKGHAQDHARKNDLQVVEIQKPAPKKPASKKKTTAKQPVAKKEVVETKEEDVADSGSADSEEVVDTTTENDDSEAKTEE